ncbi:MAG: hypothetical protein ACRBCJ_00070 [Hyphomicrobiaceae bacterium]
MLKISNATTTFNLDDIPRVAANDLHIVIEQLVAAGHAELLLGRDVAGVRENFETEFWQHFSGETRLGVAILVRLWAMVDVLAQRRLQNMLQNEGFMFVRRLAKVAAAQRLNARQGLNPQKIVYSLLHQSQDDTPQAYVPTSRAESSQTAIAA